ncbi:hypothetical protein CSB11_02730 [Candidatus Campbellbacteria bacterium]|nr:MAG: hypothetical protein CSB11_02730 [Candidatus Campbellbacteria bacterium]
MIEITKELSSFILVGIFLVSMVGLVKGSDFLLEGAERIGRYFKLPAFVIGALIVGVGTSLPELASSFVAAMDGKTGIVAANVVGSNVANILLVAGFAAILGGVIQTTKNLTNIEIPLLVISTSLFLFVAYDGTVSFAEAFIIFITFIVYIAYLLNNKKFLTEDDKIREAADEKKQAKENKEEVVTKLEVRDFALLLGGGVLLALGANYLIDSVVAMSEKFDVAEDVISMSAVAIGTSLPEILVSTKAVFRGKTDLAFGNVFGSNVFNILMITGIVGLYKNIKLDEITLQIGLPFLAITTLIFYISAQTKKIYIWEGLMFLIFYTFFALKMFKLI